jgi:phosphatidylserine/phosphatidylglycerophosphate/cardiolipin synthase-like enzyme
MRGLHILVLLVLVLPTAQPGPSSFSELGSEIGIEQLSTSPGEQLLIDEVCPGRPVEYIVLTSVEGAFELKGMTVDDGEGTIVFLSNMILEEGDSLALTADGSVFSSLRPDIPFLEKGSALLKWSGRFVLADSGDEVMLRSADGTIVDMIAYGASIYNGVGWNGPSVGSVGKAHALLRSGDDTNTSSDWSIEPPGRSAHVQATFEAVVEPFSVPENAAGRIVRELSLASRTVNCSVYEISDPLIVFQLARCASRGLEVNVLIEGQPVGGLSDRSLDAITTLTAAGADVRELRSVDSYKRYDYTHAKYMVVDHRRVTVMSENWGSGLYANRGWGVTLDGVSVGDYYDRVFAGDFNGPLDITSARSTGDIISSAADQVLDDETLRCRCEVTTLISPDFSASSLKGLIDNATDIVLIEQLYVDQDWLDGPGLLSSITRAAERGATVRLLLDSSWDRDENQAVADKLNAIARKEGYDLEAKVISPYHDLLVMHNKGLVIDDTVIISSINWGDNAVYENREAGVAVRSDRIASYFSSLFYQDWSVDPIPPAVLLPWSHIEVQEGFPALLDASNSTDNAPSLTVEWDIDGDGSVDSNATTWAVKLPVGNHTIVLTVRDRGNNTATATCWVTVVPVERTAGSPPAVLLLALPTVFVAVVMVWKRINGGKKH